MRAVLWDLDDTLLDTFDARMAALEHAYRTTVGGSIVGRELWASHRGGSLEALGQQLLGDAGPRFVTAYRDFYFGNPKRVQPHDGIPELLTILTEHDIPMGVVTQKISWGAIEELTETDILRHFQVVVGYDDTENHKPDPEPVFTALDRMAMDPGEDVYLVGDSPADVFAARNAGCRAVAALWGTLEVELLRDASPDFEADHPAKVFELLEQAATT